MYAFLVFVFVVVLTVARYTKCAEDEFITGTIYCNNNSTLYIDGELVATDPVPIIPHNAYNVSFNRAKGKVLLSQSRLLISPTMTRVWSWTTAASVRVDYARCSATAS